MLGPGEWITCKGNTLKRIEWVDGGIYTNSAVVWMITNLTMETVWVSYWLALESSRFMSNPFVPLTAGLIRKYERIPRRGDFVRYFVTPPSRYLSITVSLSVARRDVTVSFVFKVLSYRYATNSGSGALRISLALETKWNLINLLIIWPSTRIFV